MIFIDWELKPEGEENYRLSFLSVRHLISTKELVSVNTNEERRAGKCQTSSGKPCLFLLSERLISVLSR